MVICYTYGSGRFKVEKRKLAMGTIFEQTESENPEFTVLAISE